MAKFVKCPRCDLNYILEGQEYCDVCKAELGLGPSLVFAVENEKEVKVRLCPICKQVEIGEEEDMCQKCRENLDFKGDQIDYDNDEDWKNYVNDDDDGTEQDETEEEISLSKLAEEEAKLDEDFAENDLDEEEEYVSNDDFEYVDPDDPSIEDIDDEEEELEDDL